MKLSKIIKSSNQEPKPLSTVMFKGMILFLEREGKDLSSLFNQLPYPREYFIDERHFIEEKVGNMISNYIKSLYGSYEILEKIANDSAKSGGYSTLSYFPLAFLSPLRMLKFGSFIATVLDKSTKTEVALAEPDHWVFVLYRVSDFPPHPGQVYTFKGNVRNYIEFFGATDVKVEIKESYVSIDEMSPINGKIYKILKDRSVEQYDTVKKIKKIIGKLNKDNTFLWEGCLYGSYRTVYDATWTPLGRWKRIKLLWGGLRRIRQMEKATRLREKELQIKIKQLNILKKELSIKELDLEKINRQLEENNKILRGDVYRKKKELYDYYKRLKEEHTKSLAMEKTMVAIKQKIFALKN